jgi:hypothetical protein
MVQCRHERNTGRAMEIGADVIEVVDEFVYLETCITKQRDELKNVNRRIGLAKNAHCSLLPVLKSRETHRQTKIRLHKTLIRAVLLYRCET